MSQSPASQPRGNAQLHKQEEVTDNKDGYSPTSKPRGTSARRDAHYNTRTVRRRPRYDSCTRRGARYRYGNSSLTDTTSDDSDTSSDRPYYSDKTGYTEEREGPYHRYRESDRDQYDRDRSYRYYDEEKSRHYYKGSGRRRDKYDRDEYGRHRDDRDPYGPEYHSQDRYGRERYDRDEYESRHRSPRGRYGSDRYSRDRDRRDYHDRGRSTSGERRDSGHRDSYDRDRHNHDHPGHDRDPYHGDRHDHGRRERGRYERERYRNERYNNARHDKDRYDSGHYDYDRREDRGYRGDRFDRQKRGNSIGRYDRDASRESWYEEDGRPRTRENKRQDDTLRTLSRSGQLENAESKMRRETHSKQKADDKRASPGNGVHADGDRSSELPSGNKETFWQRRRRIRENRECSPIWDISPSPPRRLEDRFEVGADERKKKERKRQRKEERRARREAKRARKAANEAEMNKKPEVPAPAEEHKTDRSEPQRPVYSDEEEEIVGPAPPPTKEKSQLDYGKALRPGEGSKMAAFVQDGVRIPRRGEIGLTSEQISNFEDQGYVMSGSRNRRMEAVRIRKESQVYSAEELAALSQFSREERKAREERMLNHFRMLVEAKPGDTPSLPVRVSNDADREKS